MVAVGVHIEAINATCIWAHNISLTSLTEVALVAALNISDILDIVLMVFYLPATDTNTALAREQLALHGGGGSRMFVVVYVYTSIC